MSHLREKLISKPSNIYAIFCGVVSFANWVVVCFCLLLMQYVHTQNNQMGAEPGFPSSLKILIAGIIISVFTLAAIILIIKFRYITFWNKIPYLLEYK